MIGVVYHNYLTGSWKTVVKEQLLRLKKSGLYDKADIIWATVNLNGLTEEDYLNEIKDYNKIQTDFHINNGAEYPGIKKVKELGEMYDDIKILYFHTKGVANEYTDRVTMERNDEKIQNILSWRECLEYFVIDKWEESVSKLDEFDNVGVTCVGGWYWGNFWWSQSKHIKKCIPVDYWGRWDYESWLNNGVTGQKNFEWYNFSFNPYVTYIPEDWYKSPEKYRGSKIKLHKALYGTSFFQINEGYDGIKLGVVTDVTDVVDKTLSDLNYDKIRVYASNDLCPDPQLGNRKFLFLEISFDIEPSKIYKIGIHEGSVLDLNFNE